MDNAIRRDILARAKATGYPGSITEAFQAYDQGRDLVQEYVQQQQVAQPQMQVAQTPQEQGQGLRPYHERGQIDQSMAFPNVQPGQSFNTMGMKVPINIDKIDNQGNLVESYKAVPPGIANLPTGPYEGTVIESPARMQTGGLKEMPFGLPLKEQNPYLVPEYNQPTANGYILPDPNRPQLMDTGATEYKYSYGTDKGEVQVPSIVSGEYIGDSAYDRYRMSGEEFKPMADPSSYSKFYDMTGELGLMRRKNGGVRKYQIAGEEKGVMTWEEAKKQGAQVHMPVMMTRDSVEKWEKARENNLDNIKEEDLLQTFVNPEDAKKAKYPAYRYGQRYLDATYMNGKQVPYFTEIPPAQIDPNFYPFNNYVGSSLGYFQKPSSMVGEETEEEKYIRAVNIKNDLVEKAESRIKKMATDPTYDSYTKEEKEALIKEHRKFGKEGIENNAKEEGWDPAFTKKVIESKDKSVLSTPVLYVGYPQDDRDFNEKYGPKTWVKSKEYSEWQKSKKLGGVKKYQTGSEKETPKFKIGNLVISGVTQDVSTDNSGAPQSFDDINKVIPMPKNPTPEEGEKYFDDVYAYCAQFPGAAGCWNGTYYEKVKNPRYGQTNPNGVVEPEYIGQFSEKIFKSFPYAKQAFIASGNPGGFGLLESAGFPATYERSERPDDPGITKTFLVDTPEEIEEHTRRAKELDQKMENFDKNYGPKTWIKSKDYSEWQKEARPFDEPYPDEVKVKKVRKKLGGTSTTAETAMYEWRSGLPEDSRKRYIKGGLKNRVLYNKAKYKR
jgi:hypothetical protein